MHISRVDLNLFIVFDAIYAEGSITRASLKMSLTQPAVSHALNRLRQMFGDPLFERQGHVMVPTPMARSIIEPVRQALRGFELTLNGAERFDPTSSERTFTLALRDVLEATVLPPLMAQVASAAPGVGLNAPQVERRELESELAAGTLDAAIDVLLPLSEQIKHTRRAGGNTVGLVRRVWLFCSDSGSSTSMAASSVPAASSLSSSRRSTCGAFRPTPGAADATCAINGGSTVASSTSRSASVKVRSLLVGSKRSAPFRVSSKPRSACRTGSMMLRAIGVGTITWPWRSNSGSPNSWRRRFSAWLTAGWVRLIFRLARVMLPSA